MPVGIRFRKTIGCEQFKLTLSTGDPHLVSYVGGGERQVAEAALNRIMMICEEPGHEISSQTHNDTPPGPTELDLAH